MKIGFVLDDSLDKTDGVQQYVLTLGQWFTRQGHEVHYLVGQTKRRDIPHIHSLSRNLAVKFNQNRMSIPFPANRQRIKTLLRHQQFDVLHVQTPHSPMLGARIVKLAPRTTAVVGTFHIVPFPGWKRPVPDYWEYICGVTCGVSTDYLVPLFLRRKRLTGVTTKPLKLYPTR